MRHRRAAIADVPAQQPKEMLFNEPTSAPNPEFVDEVPRIMCGLAKEVRTMLVVTHEMAFARVVSSKVVFLHWSAIEEEGGFSRCSLSAGRNGSGNSSLANIKCQAYRPTGRYAVGPLNRSLSPGRRTEENQSSAACLGVR